MKEIRKLAILNYVNVIKNTCHTNDPFEIAAHYNLEVDIFNLSDFMMANTYLTEKDSTRHIIINEKYDEMSRRMLCAHELGHCILQHPFKIEYRDSNLELEYEANLFAVALLFDQDELPFDILDMTNFALDTILSHNIRKL